jgi:L-ribulose-5-phosphate 3-epimerase
MEAILKSNLDEISYGIYEKALPKNLSWEERLMTARQTGYDFLELSIDDSDERIERLDWDKASIGSIKKAINASGVPIQSMSLSAHRRFPLGSQDKITRQKGIDILNKAIDLSLELGIRYILIAGADDYHHESNRATQALFLEGLQGGLEKASAAGLMLALENWDIQINSLQKAMLYVEHFNSPWFQLYVDIGNLPFAGYDVLEELEFAQGHIAALHVKDTIPGQLRYVSPGEGVVPFIQVFAKLARMGFQAPVVLELWTEELPDAIDIVGKSNTWLREQMAAGWEMAKHSNSHQKIGHSA